MDRVNCSVYVNGVLKDSYYAYSVEYITKWVEAWRPAKFTLVATAFSVKLYIQY